MQRSTYIDHGLARSAKKLLTAPQDYAIACVGPIKPLDISVDSVIPTYRGNPRVVDSYDPDDGFWAGIERYLDFLAVGKVTGFLWKSY